MPRKKPRNPLKRKKVEYEQDPEMLRKNKKRKDRQRLDKFKDDEENGGKTPKEFQRLLGMMNKKPSQQQQQQQQSEERGRKKKQKNSNNHISSNVEHKEELKIQPGERMGDFVRRVDQALPMVKARSGSPSRADKRKQKQREKALRLAEEHQKRKDGDDDNLGDEEFLDQQQAEKERELKKSGKREPSPDPWAQIQARKEPTKFGDVVDRPPNLNVPSKRIKNVPKAAGSLARRSMLEEERNRFIERYRQLIENKRGDDLETHPDSD